PLSRHLTSYMTYPHSLHDALPILLAHFGELVDPEPRPLPEELIETLKHLRTRRNNVLQMLLLEKRHLAEVPPALRSDIQRHISLDRKSTRLNSSHVKISYAVFCLK